MDLEIRLMETIMDRNEPENAGTELSVIVPAFNEAQGITAFLDILFGVLRGCCARFEVWVVDDGSRDERDDQNEPPAAPDRE